MRIDCKWFQLKPPAKRPRCRYITETVNRKADIMDRESISHRFFGPFQRVWLRRAARLLCASSLSNDKRVRGWLSAWYSTRIYLTRSRAQRSVDLAVAHVNAIIWPELTNTWVPRSAAALWGTSVERVHCGHGLDVEPFQTQMNLYLTLSPNL